jgi:hypothetical protein
MRKYTSAPHPFVFDPPAGGRVAAAAVPLVLGITLFGKALGHLSHFIFALELLGKRGLGAGRVRCELSYVDAWLDGRQWSLYSVEDRIPRSAVAFEKSAWLPARPQAAVQAKSLPEQVTIEFLSPLRVVYESRLASELPFHVLVRTLLRRIGHLSYFHWGGDPSDVAFREWIECASKVETVDHDLKWYDWERYSSRQQTTMRMGGLMGRITFRGNLSPFYPFLEIGEIVRAGKGTSFGLGRFRVVSDK